ncbi:hypothetical protein BKA65DRAFT_187319 [Rhexocercosporidium sp. MPI-PUGE-AT-0058]|nr:hypothetical protein BKA65DRAFT_187319 [Rhexocercosporidium sp. MPI-PUGE-AT-0058]
MNSIEPTLLETVPDASLHPCLPFVCTICWQRQPRGSKPKILGTSARIVCRACWRAVLDLSICWVCGECIVRGDEVVSLGWCFWHRGCFGCLVCGTRLDVSATVTSSIRSESERRDEDKKSEWGKWDGSEDKAATQSARCIGVELEDIPMCRVCKVETVGESPSRVLERGLDTVTKSDGGLSRSRLDMLSSTKDRISVEPWVASRSLAKEPPKIKEAAQTEEGLKRFAFCRSNCHTSEPLNVEDTKLLLENAASMGISEDGSIDDSHSHGDTEMLDLGFAKASTSPDAAAPVVYVSVLDPIGEPAFRPSKTKPLPKWMNLLPSNVHRERQLRAKTSAEVTKYSHEMEQMRESIRSYTSDGSDDFDIDTPVPAGSRSITPTGNTKQQTTPSPIDPPQKPQKRATITFNPTSQGHTTDDVACQSKRCSRATNRICPTAQGYPCSYPSRPQTPYPRSPYLSHPSIVRNETTSYFSHRPSIATTDNNVPGYSSDPLTKSPDSSQTISHMRDLLQAPESFVDFSFPLQSSEYLERYQPKKAPEMKREKYVAGEGEPILEKIKRQKVGIKDTTDCSKEKADEMKRKRKSPMLVDEEFGLDPRREELNKELRNLFFEE